MVENGKARSRSSAAPVTSAPWGAAVAEGQVSPSGPGELSRFHGGTSRLSGPGGSPHLHLSRCKLLAPKCGQTALPQIPCGSGSSERKRQKR